MGKQLKRRYAPRLSKEIWRKYSPHIKDLRDSSVKVETINSHMWFTHGLAATTKQYKDHYSRTGQRKNLTKDELKDLYAHDLYRKQVGKKTTRYRARKKIIAARQLSRHAKEWSDVKPLARLPRSRRCPDSDDKTLTYLECSTSQYDLDNPFMRQLIQGTIEPWFDRTTSSQAASSEGDGSLDDILSRNPNQYEQMMAPLGAHNALPALSDIPTYSDPLTDNSVNSLLSRYSIESEGNMMPWNPTQPMPGFSDGLQYDDPFFEIQDSLPEPIGIAHNDFGQCFDPGNFPQIFSAESEDPMSTLLWPPGPELMHAFDISGGQSFGPASSAVVPEPIGAVPGAWLEPANGDFLDWENGWLSLE